MQKDCSPSKASATGSTVINLTFLLISCFIIIISLAFTTLSFLHRYRILNSTIVDLNRRIALIQAEQERSALQTTTVFDHLREGVIVFDRFQKITMMNRTACSIFGNSKGQNRNSYLIDVVQNERLVNLASSAIQNRNQEVENLQLRRDRPTDLRIYISGLESLEGGAAGILIAYDVTEINKLEAIRKDFVANVSHELKTPLTSIKGFAETLLSGNVSDQAQLHKFLTIIKEDSDRLERLIHDVLELSKIESGSATSKRECIDLRNLIEETVALLDPQVQLKSIRLECQLPENEFRVVGDHDQLLQVFVNLVDNAVKYNRQGGLIKISAEHSDAATVVIHIEDTGMGIAEGQLHRIFERFYRVDAARSRELGGTGLGLSIAKHIIESHQGKIECSSRLGQGTTFSVFLPHEFLNQK